MGPIRSYWPMVPVDPVGPWAHGQAADGGQAAAGGEWAPSLDTYTELYRYLYTIRKGPRSIRGGKKGSRESFGGVQGSGISYVQKIPLTRMGPEGAQEPKRDKTGPEADPRNVRL